VKHKNGGFIMKSADHLHCHGTSPKGERFLEVCLLLLLQEEAGHCYGLIDQLSAFGFSPEKLNVSTLYRTLRKMEQEGTVHSTWEQGGPGPKRRVYHVTDNGTKELDRCIRIMKSRKNSIERLITRYDEMPGEK
jgi:DNA-binding PadR family transcriptional regulator